MIADEAKFLVLNTQSLWQEGRIEADADGIDSIRVSPDGISLRDYRTHVLTNTYDLGKLRPVDFALDGCGLLYLLDSVTKAIVVFDPNTGNFERVRCISLTDPKAIAVDQDNVYVADGGQVCCLARANYQIRWLASIEGAALTDLAVDGAGNLYALDDNGRKVYRINRAGIAAEFELSSTLTEPLGITLDKGGKLYVLEAAGQVHRFEAGGALESTISPSLAAGFEPSSLATDADGNIFIGDERESGFPCRIDPTAKTTAIGYQGTVLRLVVSRRGDLYVLGETEIAFLKLVTRYVNAGVYVSAFFDSTVPDCQWHKVVADVDIPANTRLSVSHYISNNEVLPVSPVWSTPIVNFSDALVQGPKGRYIWFRIELLSDDLHASSPRLRSLRAYFPRLSYLRYLPATYQEDKTGREFLEKFLSLFETFFAGFEREIATLARYFDAQATPDSFLPWLSSWLAIARDENWASEKVRLLIARAPELYRRRGTRDGIEQIIELYTGQKPIIVENLLFDCLQQKTVKTSLKQKAARGERLLRVADSSLLRAEDIIKVGDGVNEEFAVIDRKEGDALALRGHLGADYAVGSVVRPVTVEEALYGGCPFQFCVLLKPGQVKSASEFNAVARIIEREKPAHTVGGLKSLQPWLYLNMHTYLGINSALTEPVFVLGQSSALSRDTALSDREESGQMDLRSRVAMDTRLT